MSKNASNTPVPPEGAPARRVLRLAGAPPRPAQPNASEPRGDAAKRPDAVAHERKGRSTAARRPQRDAQPRQADNTRSAPRNVWRNESGQEAGKATRGGPPRSRAAASAAPSAPSFVPAAPARSPAQKLQVTDAAAAGIRLNKRMADMGLCSRREADDWISRGWVFVNGEPAEMGLRVQETDSIHVDKAAYVQQEQQVTFLLHKPVGYVSGQPEDGYPSAATLLGSSSRWPGDKANMRFLPRQLRGLAPAGRLDIDSTGLLVLTQDGRIARQLIGADSTTDKEYLVRVEYATPQGVVRERVQAAFPPEKLALLRHGLSLDGQALQPAQVDWQNPEQLRFVLTEGKKRQIRRMCEAVGLHVVGLKRVRIGRIMLGDLPSGQWRFLRADERF